ncbi:MAG: type II toxin-antitoxin system RelE/ParE family toxin [Raoultibacter sp.]
MFDVDFYRLPDGSVPLEQFLDSLSEAMRIKAIQELTLLGEMGNELRAPHSKHIRNGVFELRIKRSNNIARIFYFFFVEQRIIATNGFIKKTQKTPKTEIDKALRYKADWEERNKR